MSNLFYNDFCVRIKIFLENMIIFQLSSFWNNDSNNAIRHRLRHCFVVLFCDGTWTWFMSWLESHWIFIFIMTTVPYRVLNYSHQLLQAYLIKFITTNTFNTAWLYIGHKYLYHFPFKLFWVTELTPPINHNTFYK